MNPNSWDIATTNWDNTGKADRFYNGDNVIFNDTGSSLAVAVQTAGVSPALSASPMLPNPTPFLAVPFPAPPA